MSGVLRRGLRKIARARKRTVGEKKVGGDLKKVACDVLNEGVNKCVSSGSSRRAISSPARGRKLIPRICAYMDGVYARESGSASAGGLHEPQTIATDARRYDARRTYTRAPRSIR